MQQSTNTPMLQFVRRNNCLERRQFTMDNSAKSTELLAACLVIVPTLLGVFSDEFHIFALGSAAVLFGLVGVMALPQARNRWLQNRKNASR